MITLVEAKNLQHGTQLYHISYRNHDGTPQRWRVNGKPRTWKTRPKEVCVPIKHALKNHDYLTHNDLALVCTNEHDAYVAGLRHKCMDDIFGKYNDAIRFLVFPQENNSLPSSSQINWQGVDKEILEWRKGKMISKGEEGILLGLYVTQQGVRS